MAQDSRLSIHRVERIIAYMIAATIGLSVVCFIALIIATATGVSKEQFSEAPWPTVIVLPLVGLPIGVILIITLVVIIWLRRGREAKDVRK